MSKIIKAGPPVPPQSAVTLMGARKSDQVGGVITNGSDAQLEDTFTGSYTTQGNLGMVAIIEPTFLPLQLAHLVTKNNVLSQCIDAMEVNVDGTGHTFELVEDADSVAAGTKAPESLKEKAILEDFFNEPYPGKSMISIRRDMRRDLESCGWACLETIRAVDGSLVMLNHLESDSIRLVRLDDPVFVSKTIKRGGSGLEVKIRARERRFVQMINGKRVFFKEFGAARDLDRDTGMWADSGMKLSIAKRASEVMYFTVNKEVRTPYGAPRWINQLPSVIGSRKAEEHNLDFFAAGGLPPVLVLVQGGYLGSDVKASLEAHLSGTGGRHRAAVVEAIAASGSLDSSGSVKVTVERFGAERQQDAMFMTYDKNCEEHVRVAFRLPPLFIGRAGDYSFATAMTGYMIAEAQVFAPERKEFDDRMQQLILALGVTSYKFKSNPITLKDAANSMAALNSALVAKVVTSESAVEEINKVTGMNLDFQDPPMPPALAPAVGAANGLPAKASAKVVPITSAPKSLQLVSKEEATQVTHLVYLAEAWGSVLGLRGPCPYDDERISVVKKAVNDLTGNELHVFNEILASHTLVGVDETTEGIAQLCGVAANLIKGP